MEWKAQHMKTIATAEIQGSYGVETVNVYSQNGFTRFYAPSWRPMRFTDHVTACRKIASHPKFVRFIES